MVRVEKTVQLTWLLFMDVCFSNSAISYRLTGAMTPEPTGLSRNVLVELPQLNIWLLNVFTY